MAENKKSFVLYCDLVKVVEKLLYKDRENKTNYAGELFYHILLYVNDKEQVPIDFIIDLSFEPIKAQLKRDLQKYEHKCLKNSDNAKMRWNKENAIVCEPINTNAKHADTVTDIDTDTDTDTVIELKKEILSFESFWDLFNKKIDSKKCRSKFEKLSEKDKVKIKNTLPNYIGLTPDVKFRKNPLTYLNGFCWNDEIYLSPEISEENKLCLYTNQSIQRENKEVEGTYSRYLRDVECYGVDNVKFISYV